MSDKEAKTKRYKSDGIMVAEYEYIAQTAFQAQEDRARVTTFYLVSVGSLFAAFFGTQNTPSSTTYWAFAGLFLFLSYFGIVTLRQLIRLRHAWFESARAMNQIKDFLITQNNDLEKAFRWNSKTLPDRYKPESVAYLLALQVAMLGAVTFSVMIFYISLAISASLALNENLQIDFFIFIGVIIGGLLFLRYQLNLYRKELSIPK